MTCDFINLSRSGVQALQVYEPGKPVEDLQRELGLSNIIKLASNENPLGPSAKVLKAISNAKADLSRYPDGNGFVLKAALEEKYSIKAEQITLGNGSNDVLELVGKAYLNPGDEVIFSEHAFAVYYLVTMANDAVPVVAPAIKMGHDLDGMLASITSKTKIIFLANPNNPTGTWVNRNRLESFLADVPDNVIVVLDEAYIEYVDEEGFPDGLQYLKDYPNLLITRTFSKAYGLAGLRIGYGISGFAIADILNRVRQPFNVNSLAMVAACAALADTEYLRQSVVLNKAGMQQIEQGLNKMNLKFIPSVGNFISFRVTKAADVYESLLREGVIVRPIANYGMADFLRVSIGTRDENTLFLEKLAKVVNHGN